MVEYKATSSSFSNSMDYKSIKNEHKKKNYLSKTPEISLEDRKQNAEETHT